MSAFQLPMSGFFLVRGFDSLEEVQQGHPNAVPNDLPQRTAHSAQRALRAQQEHALRQEQVTSIKRGDAYSNYRCQVEPWERKPSQSDHLWTPRLNDPDFPRNLQLWKERLEIFWGPPPGIRARFSAFNISSERIIRSHSLQEIMPARYGISSPSLDRASSPKKTPSEETLRQRIKQISYGKNTNGYRRYTDFIPLESRDPYNPLHPVTPRLDTICLSAFRGELRKWRRALHAWDDCTSSHSSEHACMGI